MIIAAPGTKLSSLGAHEAAGIIRNFVYTSRKVPTVKEEPMSYLEKSLVPGETVVYRTGLHWVVLVPSVLVGVCLALLAIVVWRASMGSEQSASRALTLVGLTLLGLGIVTIIHGLVRRRATEIAVTSMRIFIKRGLVTRHTTELLLAKVESIAINEPLMGRILGYGTVVVRGTGGTPEPFDKIANPLEFRREVQRQIEILPSPGPHPMAAAQG